MYSLESDVHEDRQVRFAQLSQQLFLGFWFSASLGLVWVFSSSRSTVAMVMQVCVPVLVSLVYLGTGFLALFRKERLIDQLGLGALRRVGLMPSLACVRRAAHQLHEDDGLIFMPQPTVCNWTSDLIAARAGDDGLFEDARAQVSVNITSMTLAGSAGEYWRDSHGSSALGLPAYAIRVGALSSDSLLDVYHELRAVALMVFAVLVILYAGQLLYCIAPGPVLRPGEINEGVCCEVDSCLCGAEAGQSPEVVPLDLACTCCGIRARQAPPLGDLQGRDGPPQRRPRCCEAVTVTEGDRKPAGQGVVCRMAFCGLEESDLQGEDDDSDDEGQMSLGGGGTADQDQAKARARSQLISSTNDWPAYQQRAIEFARQGLRRMHMGDGVAAITPSLSRKRSTGVERRSNWSSRRGSKQDDEDVDLPSSTSTEPEVQDSGVENDTATDSAGSDSVAQRELRRVQGVVLLTLKVLLFVSLLLALPDVSGAPTGCSPMGFSATMAAVASGAIATRFGPEPNLGQLQELEGLLSFGLGSSDRITPVATALVAAQPAAPFMIQAGSLYRTTLLGEELNFEAMQKDTGDWSQMTIIWAMAVHMIAEAVALAAVLLMMRHVAFVVELRQGTARSEERRRALLAMLRLLLHDTLSPLNALSLSLEESGDSLEHWSSFAAGIRRLWRRHEVGRESGTEGRNLSSDSVRRRAHLLESTDSIVSRRSGSKRRGSDAAGKGPMGRTPSMASMTDTGADFVSKLVTTAGLESDMISPSGKQAMPSPSGTNTPGSRGRSVVRGAASKKSSSGSASGHIDRGSASPQTDHSRSSRSGSIVTARDARRILGAPRPSLLKQMRTLRKDVVPAMASASGGIQRILSDMVSLQDAQNGKLRLAMEATNLAQAVSESIFRAFRALASTNSIHLSQWADGVAEGSGYQQLAVKTFDMAFTSPELVLKVASRVKKSSRLSGDGVDGQDFLALGLHSSILEAGGTDTAQLSLTAAARGGKSEGVVPFHGGAVANEPQSANLMLTLDLGERFRPDDVVGSLPFAASLLHLPAWGLVPPSATILVMCDLPRLQQCLANYCSNALKFSKSMHEEQQEGNSRPGKQLSRVPTEQRRSLYASPRSRNLQITAKISLESDTVQSTDRKRREDTPSSQMEHPSAYLGNRPQSELSGVHTADKRRQSHLASSSFEKHRASSGSGQARALSWRERTDGSRKGSDGSVNLPSTSVTRDAGRPVANDTVASGAVDCPPTGTRNPTQAPGAIHVGQQTPALPKQGSIGVTRRRTLPPAVSAELVEAVPGTNSGPQLPSAVPHAASMSNFSDRSSDSRDRKGPKAVSAVVAVDDADAAAAAAATAAKDKLHANALPENGVIIGTSELPPPLWDADSLGTVGILGAKRLAAFRAMSANLRSHRRALRRRSQLTQQSNPHAQAGDKRSKTRRLSVTSRRSRRFSISKDLASPRASLVSTKAVEGSPTSPRARAADPKTAVADQSSRQTESHGSAWSAIQTSMLHAVLPSASRATRSRLHDLIATWVTCQAGRTQTMMLSGLRYHCAQLLHQQQQMAMEAASEPAPIGSPYRFDFSAALAAAAKQTGGDAPQRPARPPTSPRSRTASMPASPRWHSLKSRQGGVAGAAGIRGGMKLQAVLESDGTAGHTRSTGTNAGTAGDSDRKLGSRNTNSNTGTTTGTGTGSGTVKSRGTLPASDASKLKRTDGDAVEEGAPSGTDPEEPASIRRVRRVMEHVQTKRMKEMAEISRGARTVSFWVWDDGAGIAAKDRRRVFQPFSQIDANLQQGGKGSGLGLAITEGIVKLHGGAVGFMSAKGLGSIFWAWIRCNTRWQSPGKQLSQRGLEVGEDEQEEEAREQPRKGRGPGDRDAVAESPPKRAILGPTAAALPERTGAQAAFGSAAGRSRGRSRGKGSDSLEVGASATRLRAGGARRRSQREALKAAPSMPRRLLCVDDERSNRRLLAGAVRRLGIGEVYEATDGVDALLKLGVPRELWVGYKQPARAAAGADAGRAVRAGDGRRRAGKGSAEVRPAGGTAGPTPTAAQVAPAPQGAAVDADGGAPGAGAPAATSRPQIQLGPGDVILMDYSMPLMGGAQCTRSIKADKRFKGVRVIGVTGNVLLEDQQRLLRAGAERVLPKPVLRRTLQDALLSPPGRRGGSK